MICKKCNKEIEYTASVCPHCGEKCVETDDFFHEMLSHVMDENTQSSEELDKLKETMKKRKKNRRRNRILVIAGIVALLAVGFGVFRFVSWYMDKNVNHGTAVYRAEFDGTVFSVLDEDGREIRTFSGGTYTENTYGSENQKIAAVTYNGFVSFEKTNFENNLPKTIYNFDGTSSYTYKDFMYTINDNELPEAATFSSKAGEESGMCRYTYDENGNKLTEYNYQFIGKKSHNYDYDSVGRVIGEQEYDDNGELIYDKQYSYKSDGSVYLSSVKEPHIFNSSGAVDGYIVKHCLEDGTYSSGSIIAPDNSLIGSIKYVYDGGNLTEINYYTTADVQNGWEKFEYSGNGQKKKYSKKYRGVETEEYYSYEYHDKDEKILKSVSVFSDEDSSDRISYTEYNESGKEIKIITATENTEKTYTDIGLIESVSTYSSKGELIRKTTYQYDQDGNCSSQTDFGSDGKVIEQRAYAYDGMGNVINQAGGESDYLYVNEYDDSYNLISVTTYRLLSSKLFEYDEKGHISRQTIDNATVGFERLRDGRVSKKFSYNPDGSTHSYVEYEYDDENNQAGLISYDANGNLLSRTEITYNDRAKIISLRSTDSNDKEFYNLEYNYSSDSPSVKINGTTNIDGKTDKYSYSFTFDKNGCLSGVEYSKNGTKTAEYTYTHNEIGDVTSGTVHNFHPTDSVTKYEYTYEDGHLSSVTAVMPGNQETKTEYALDENKRPYLKTGDQK